YACLTKSGTGSTSQTKKIQVEEKEIDGITYRLIDTVGIGDTGLTEGSKRSPKTSGFTARASQPPNHSATVASYIDSGSFDSSYSPYSFTAQLFATITILEL
ncbi:7896_t:CDS:1, partial [Paraglomus occultum]